MVSLELEEDEYELIEKWFGMVFGKEESKGKFAPKDIDIQLFNKLSQMHMATLKNELKEKKRLMDMFKSKDKDDDKDGKP